MSADRRVETVEIAGRQVDAEKLICYGCDPPALYLDTDIDTTDSVLWKATCPYGHSWEFCW